MGFLSGLKKVGKIALAAAPYVAAPFTGGASLSLAPMANKALGKWNEHDANVAATKGLGPSKFDKILGVGANVAGMGAGGAGILGSLGKLGKAGSTASSTSSLIGKKVGWGDVLNPTTIQSRVGELSPFLEQLKNMRGGGKAQGQDYPGVMSGSGTAPSVPLGQMPAPSAPYDQQFGGNFGQDQNNPNLANAINQGKIDAQRNRRPMIPLQRQYGYNG